MARTRRLAVVVGAVLVVLCGCTAAPGVSAEQQTAPGADKTAAVASTCQSMMLIETNLGNATGLLQQGEITEDQFSYLTRSASVDLFILANAPDLALADEVKAVADAQNPAVPAEIIGAPFDPSAEEFRAAMGAMYDACEANGTPIGVQADYAGG